MYTSGSILVTEDCNLRCTYCFEKKKKNFMSIEVAKDTLQFFFNNAEDEKNPNERNVSLTFFGGEPTLNPEVIDFMIREGYKMSQDRNIPISFTMITNCTGLPKLIENVYREYMDKVNFTVQLSIDGLPEVQDRYRITKDGKGSWEMVKKVIPKWKDIFKDKPQNLNIHGCINKHSLPKYFESYKFFKYEIGIGLLWFLPITEEKWTKRDVELYRQQSGLIYEDLIGTIRKDGFSHIHDIAPFDKAINGCRMMSDKTCAAGSSYCAITAKGDIYPCHQFYFDDPDTYLGNIYDGIKDQRNKIYLDFDGSDLNCDPDCNHGNCYRCIAANHQYNGSMFDQTQGLYCDFMHVDKYYQEQFIKDLEDMGIKKEMQERRICNSHTTDASKGCDVVEKKEVKEAEEKSSCSCGGSCGSSKDKDITKMLKKIMLDQKKIIFEIEYLKQAIKLNDE